MAVISERNARIRFPLTGLSAAAALLFGVALCQGLPTLPSLGVILSLSALGIAFAWRPNWLRLIGVLLLGLAWAALRGDVALDARLASELEGRDVSVSGTVIGLPRATADAMRFDFAVDSAQLTGGDVVIPKRVRISWYGGAPQLDPGSRWELSLRLKRPHGGVNPGGYDFERYMLERGLGATGYVREGSANRKLGERAFSLDRIRVDLADGIATVLPDGKTVGTLRALAVGDQRFLTERDWDVLRATGTGHLIAISGLHVGLMAGLGALLARGLRRLWPRLALRVPAQQTEALAALLAATLYSALAGFALPTVRTLLMIAVVLLARLARRVLAPTQAFGVALIAVLIVDPLAVLSPGFWLSFLGVAWLLLCLSPTPGKRWWRELVGAQLAMSIGLLPLTAWYFGQSSLVGPLANLVAVPWVSFVVVPLTLLGCALLPISHALAAWPLAAADGCMRAQWWLLERLAALPGSELYLSETSVFAMLLALVGASVLLLPRGLPGKPLALVLFLPLLWPARATIPEGEFEVATLDVGQGLSVLVRTANHALLYDAGASFPGGLDLGEAAVVPALRALGVPRIDRLVISHADNDHAGGAHSVVAAYRPEITESSTPQKLAVPATFCVKNTAWVWDGVEFRYLHPPTDFPDLGNDGSCVLLVTTQHAALLLPGDISETIEPRLLESMAALPEQLLLLAPQHGSKSSSSAAFVAALQPDIVVYSAGHLSRFGHPHPDVVARYGAVGSAALNTADSGFVRIRSSGNNNFTVVERGRSDRPRYWRTQ